MSQQPNPTLVSFDFHANFSNVLREIYNRINHILIYLKKRVMLCNGQRGEMGGNMWVAIAEREHKLERARKQMWSVVFICLTLAR